MAWSIRCACGVDRVTLLFRLWKFLGRWPWLQQILLRVLNPSFLVGVTAVLLDSDGKVVLFHHTYRRRFAWGLPGGFLRRGEEPAAALVREIREEAGLTVDLVAPLAATTRTDSGNFELIYLARLTGGAFTPSAEVDQIGRFAKDDLPELRKYQKVIVLAAIARN